MEAVSIDPENAKYRHTLGVAKCATGDEAGAQEELLEAALLDEEDAEDGYQLRMQREREARKTWQKRRKDQDSEEGARQVLFFFAHPIYYLRTSASLSPSNS